MTSIGSIAGLELMNAGQIEQKPDYGRWLIYGNAGHGKSYLASTIAKLGKTLYVDLVGERGVRSFGGSSWAKNIDIARPKTIQTFDDLFYKLDSEEHPYNAVIIDSFTAAQKMAMRFALGQSETAVKEIKKGGPTAEFKTWGMTLDIMSDTAIYWCSLADGARKKPIHVIFTAQVKEVDNEFESVTERVPDVQKGAISQVLRPVDYVVYVDVEDSDEFDEVGSAKPRFIALFGPHKGYRTKARVPVDLHGKIPPVLGRILRIGGVPQAAPAAVAPAKASA
jgi:hypothetical protein